MATTVTPFAVEEEQARRTVEEHIIEFGLRIPLLKVRETKTGIFSRMAPVRDKSQQASAGAKELLNSSVIKVRRLRTASACANGWNYAGVPAQTREQNAGCGAFVPGGV